jgi:hypothetical protein
VGRLNGHARKMDMPLVLFQYGGATTPERLHGHAIIGFFFCGGTCTTSQNKVAESSWCCYGLDQMIYVGQAKICWGHSKGDATWACNNWMPNCQKYGGCVAKNVWYFDSLTCYNSFIKCGGTGGACYMFD